MGIILKIIMDKQTERQVFFFGKVSQPETIIARKWLEIDK